ncbi:PilZ domain-containing protein [Humidesulfovibrio mexicanus]|uniref:PilZ domain-containing protein n=1 Tax=Humidesulfovibrio mexicanus TaxID=147047 RepID=A0A239CJF3_9BACT|nr:PilZ domain-containing protein [Humidesulfovibrio mexicanus]SNS20366.1 PilZ domain-containing protein [Humidesulfovibrio mexicanus]
MSPETACLALDPAVLLRAGAEAFIVLHKDALRERIDVRQTRVLDWEGDVLFLAQTDPPVPREASGAQAEVVALAPACGEELRPMGYVARVLDVRPDYPSAGLAVEAIAVSAPTPCDLFETSLRMHYRVPVEEDMGVGILLEGFETPQLLDFSAGGARVLVDASEQAYADLAVGKSIPFRLLFVGSGYAAGDAVVRSLRREDDRATCGLFFTNMEIRDIRYLERMVARVVSACRQREGDAGYV